MATAKPFTILVVDDDRAILHAIARMLAPRQVHLASTPKDAFEIERRWHIDVAIVDVFLGTSSGLELVREMRHRDRDLVIGVMSARMNIELANDSHCAGADWFLAKPFRVGQLLSYLSRPRVYASAVGTIRSRKQADWEHINHVLAACGGNKSEAARRLGVPRQSLQRMLARGAPQDERDPCEERPAERS